MRSCTECALPWFAGSAGIPAGPARLALAGGSRSVVARPDTAQADAADVARCLKGDDEAFRLLVERHQRHIAALMWRFSRDPEVHADLVQEVFIEAWRSLASYRAKAPLEHWLTRIGTRVGYRHWREQERERALAQTTLDECAELRAPEELEPSEAGELLHRLLQELAPRDRLAITLRYLEEYTVREVAELTGWSETMVKVQAWRARRRLQRLFERVAGEAGGHE